MPIKSPEQISWLTYIPVFALAIFGGVVSYLKKLKHGKKWNWKDLLIELTTSAFAGITTYLLCRWTGIDEIGSSAVAGIAGRYADYSMLLFKKILERVLGKAAKK